MSDKDLTDAMERKLALRSARIFISIFFLVTVIVISNYMTSCSPSENINKTTWSIGVYEGKTPFDLNAPEKDMNPVLHAGNLPKDEASLVAHPRMIIKDSVYYLFYTAVNQDTDSNYKIGLAESTNGYEWEFKQIIMDGSYNLAHPFVFEFENKFYMIPEPAGGSTASIYIAEDFPYKWKYEKDLITKEKLNSPFVFRHDNTWWLIHSSEGNDALYLYYADDLYGPWEEHPQSPVITNNKQTARPAGRPFLYNGNLYRLAINCIPQYGTSVLAFQINELTKTSFKETKIEKPFIEAAETGWNSIGMHHADVHQIGENHWIAVVDGHGVVYE